MVSRKIKGKRLIEPHVFASGRRGERRPRGGGCKAPARPPLGGRPLESSFSPPFGGAPATSPTGFMPGIKARRPGRGDGFARPGAAAHRGRDGAARGGAGAALPPTGGDGRKAGAAGRHGAAAAARRVRRRGSPRWRRSRRATPAAPAPAPPALSRPGAPRGYIPPSSGTRPRGAARSVRYTTTLTKVLHPGRLLADQLPDVLHHLVGLLDRVVTVDRPGIVEPLRALPAQPDDPTAARHHRLREVIVEALLGIGVAGVEGADTLVRHLPSRLPGLKPRPCSRVLSAM